MTKRLQGESLYPRTSLMPFWCSLELAYELSPSSLVRMAYVDDGFYSVFNYEDFYKRYMDMYMPGIRKRVSWKQTFWNEYKKTLYRVAIIHGRKICGIKLKRKR